MAARSAITINGVLTSSLRAPFFVSEMNRKKKIKTEKNQTNDNISSRYIFHETLIKAASNKLPMEKN